MHPITSCVCIDVYSKSQIKAVEEMSDGGSSNRKKDMQIYQDAKQPVMLSWIEIILLHIQNNSDLVKWFHWHYLVVPELNSASL